MLAGILNLSWVRKAVQIWTDLPDKLKVWIKGAVAVIEGAVTATIVQAWWDPTIHTVNLYTIKQVAAAAFTGAVIALRMYLRTSPLKPVLQEVVKDEWDGIDRRNSQSKSIGAGS